MQEGYWNSSTELPNALGSEGAYEPGTVLPKTPGKSSARVQCFV